MFDDKSFDVKSFEVKSWLMVVSELIVKVIGSLNALSKKLDAVRLKITSGMKADIEQSERLDKQIADRENTTLSQRVQTTSARQPNITRSKR